MISRGNSRYLLKEFSSTNCAQEIKKTDSQITSNDSSKTPEVKQSIRISPSGRVAHEFGIVDHSIERKANKRPSTARTTLSPEDIQATVGMSNK